MLFLVLRKINIQVDESGLVDGFTNVIHLMTKSQFSTASCCLAFYQGLKLSFVYGALIFSITALGLVLRTRHYNLAPSALVAVVGKIK